MLLIALAIMCLAASMNADKVADWYWDYKYNNEKEAAVALLSQGLSTSPATITSSGPYERGNLIDFTIHTQDGPYPVQRYQPRPVEEAYVEKLYPGKHIVVSYASRFPNRCILPPSLEQAKRIAGRPKPARMPDDKIARFVSLAGKVLAGLLLLGGIYTFRRDI